MGRVPVKNHPRPPKRPAANFFRFHGMHFPRFKKDPRFFKMKKDGTMGIDVPRISSELGRMWREEVPQEEKLRLKTLGVIDRELYRVALAEYKAKYPGATKRKRRVPKGIKGPLSNFACFGRDTRIILKVEPRFQKVKKDGTMGQNFDAMGKEIARRWRYVKLNRPNVFESCCAESRKDNERFKRELVQYRKGERGRKIKAVFGFDVDEESDDDDDDL